MPGGEARGAGGLVGIGGCPAARERCPVSRVRIERSAGAGEAVHVWQRARSGAPEEFIWRGRRYLVRSVESDQVSRPPVAGGVRRLRVRTTSGLQCILAQDPALGSWKMDRVVSSGGGR